MATEEIHVGDIGTIFRITVNSDSSPLDISAASTKQIIFRKPDGNIMTKDAAFYTDGTDGIIQYATLEDDLSIAGTWKIQALVALPSGNWRSSISEVTVYANL